ncbi:hypothetical protein ACFJIY_18260 [Pimelobacter simplex]|uniref:hypothetical protein n=1 Tax=Nocardioides simplex TaxID=2045 RepID=UPI003670004A
MNMKLMSRALVALALGASALLLPPSAAQAAPAAPTAEPSIQLKAVAAGNVPLENVRWNIFKKDPVSGTWDQGIQAGPLLTGPDGSMSWNVAAGATYKVCFYDDDYDYNTRAVRYADRCWDGAATQATATEWTPTAQQPTLTGSVTLPSAGSSLTVGHPWVDGSAKVGVPLTVRPGVWGPEGVALTYQWITLDGGVRTPIAGATGTTFTPTAAQAGKTVMVDVTGTLAGYRTAMSRRLVGKVGGTTPTMTGTLAIQGTPMPGNTLTIKPGLSFAPAGTDPMATWYVNGKPVGGSTDLANSSLVVTNAMAGAPVELRVIAYNWDCCDSQLYASAQTTIGGGVTTSPKPTVSGSAVVGSTLTAQAGTWAPGGVTLAYQWLRDGAPIANATGATYALAEADRGKKITVKVTGTLAGGYPPVARTSDPTATVQGVLAQGTPTIAGQPVVGQTLTATPGTWTPTPAFAYEWFAGGTKITGATGATYQPVAADRGKAITVTVTGTLSGYQSASRTSAATGLVQGVLTSATPTISGDVVVGGTLTANAGAWGPTGVALTYQWLRDDAPIGGATAPTYVLTDADAGKAVTVKVTGTLSGYVTTSRTSLAAGAVLAPFAAAPAPTVSGRTTVGQTLTAGTGTWDPAPTFGYQWLRSGSPIAGATGATYRLSAADAGTRISVRVTGTLDGYVTTATTSAPTATVTGTFTSAPVPRISGKAKVGKKLTAKPGAWAPTATVRYQWLRNGKVIKGATRATYKLAKADRGKRVSVRVTGTRTGYVTVVRTSAATKKVAR